MFTGQKHSQHVEHLNVTIQLQLYSISTPVTSNSSKDIKLIEMRYVVEAQ